MTDSNDTLNDMHADQETDLAFPKVTKAKLIPVIGVNPTFPALETFSLSAFAIQFLANLFTRKGQFMRVSWRRDLKTRKGVESTIEKVVVAVVRAGIDYDNREKVKEGRADGTLPEQNAGLPWGKWLVFPYLIEHKGTLYVRLYPSETNKAHTEFFLNGVSARREEIEPLCLASEFQDREEAPLCFTVKLASIQNAETH